MGALLLTNFKDIQNNMNKMKMNKNENRKVDVNMVVTVNEVTEVKEVVIENQEEQQAKEEEGEVVSSSSICLACVFQKYNNLGVLFHDGDSFVHIGNGLGSSKCFKLFTTRTGQLDLHLMEYFDYSASFQQEQQERQKQRGQQHHDNNVYHNFNSNNSNTNYGSGTKMKMKGLDPHQESMLLSSSILNPFVCFGRDLSSYFPICHLCRQLHGTDKNKNENEKKKQRYNGRRKDRITKKRDTKRKSNKNRKRKRESNRKRKL